MKTIISLQNITKIFNNCFVLDNINLDIYEAEFLSIVGMSGSGKSTLLKILCGIEQPTDGKIFKSGIDITDLQISRRKIGYIFQDYALFPNMTVFDNILYALSSKKMSKSEKKELVLDILSKFCLLDKAKSYPSDLSGGQKQRVAIARTMILKPDVLLFDEPLSALDSITKVQLKQFIKSIQKQYNTTIVYITHDVEEAFELSDRIAVIESSEITQIDSPDRILKSPKTKFIQDFISTQLKDKYISIGKILK